MPSTPALVTSGLRPLALLGLGLLAALASPPAQATILLFDQERDAATGTIVGPAGSGGVVPGDYGDNVTGALMAVPGGFFTYGEAGEGFTHNVSVDLYTSLATPTNSRVRLWQTGYGDLVNVVLTEGPGTAGSPLLYVRFVAEPGYEVDLYGFDLAGFGVDYTIAGVSVLAGAESLYSSTNVLVEGDASGAARTTFAFTAPLSAPELLLTIDLSNLSAGIQDNIGLDNVRFGQTPPPIVPEPGTAVLVFVGLAHAAALRRGRRARGCARDRTGDR